MEQNKQFTKTRITLSLWYSFILFIILLGFSLVLFITYSNDVTRIVLQQDFGNHVPRTLSLNEKRVIIAQVKELRQRARQDLFFIDIVTLLLGTGFSFFLAGKTLSPIQKNMQSQKLFIADASHELKSPITTIQTACEVVLRNTSKTKEEYKKVLEQVQEQSERLGRLVNDLLLLSVLDTVQSTKNFQICSLSDIAQKQAEAMTEVIKKAGLTIEKFTQPNISILGDADKINQLVIILLDNAIKYTPTGGKISVTVSLSPQPKLIVADTGIGIAKEKQKDIFKRFYQAETSRTGQGAGLGLSIAQSIMHFHSGTITVNSSVRKGSTFTCVFPNK